MKNTNFFIFLLLFVFSNCEENIENPDIKPIVSTVSGSEKGYQDGELDVAKFEFPTRLEIAEDGSIIVIEKTKIRKISTSGIVSTIAGDTAAGYVNAIGRKARFKALFGVAVSGNGDLYVTDAENFCIRKIETNGNVTTVAGDGTEGYQDGPGLKAKFGNMGDLDISADGTLYVCDAHNQRIRKISTDGMVTTIAGGGNSFTADGPAEEVVINGAMDLSFDVDGTIYFVDSWGHRIRKLTPDVMVISFAGDSEMNSGFADGVGNEARFINPMGIDVSNDGILVVADTWNNRIRYITQENEVSTIAGDDSYGFKDGPANEAMFNQPFDVAVANDGTIYIADTHNNKIRKITFE